jgi:hypothetical protein
MEVVFVADNLKANNMSKFMPGVGELVHVFATYLDIKRLLCEGEKRKAKQKKKARA